MAQKEKDFEIEIYIENISDDDSQSLVYEDLQVLEDSDSERVQADDGKVLEYLDSDNDECHYLDDSNQKVDDSNQNLDDNMQNLDETSQNSDKNLDKHYQYLGDISQSSEKHSQNLDDCITSDYECEVLELDDCQSDTDPVSLDNDKSQKQKQASKKLEYAKYQLLDYNDQNDLDYQPITKLDEEQGEDNEDVYVEYLDEDLLLKDEGNEVDQKQDENLDDYDQFQDSSDEYLPVKEEAWDFEGLDDDDSEDFIIENSTRKRQKRNIQQNDSSKRKWPKKLPPKDRYRTYKQYTDAQFRNCIDAIRYNNMNKKDASELFNIPLKTIIGKIRAGILETGPPPMSRTTKFAKEIKTLLKHTNVTPFKSRFNKYYCGFCKDGDQNHFEPSQLRNHMKNHVDILQKVEFMVRPFYLNECVKIDVKDLKCTTCDEEIQWDNLQSHLKIQHCVELSYYNFIIPFILDVKLECVLCSKYFSGFVNLDAHMNSHYRNYSCSQCGETYITNTRLKSHLKIHEQNGVFTCEECGRVFTLERYLKKHQDLKHRTKLTHKCSFCVESFRTEKLLNLHTLMSHKDKIKHIQCEHCDAVFLFDKMYRRHLYKEHNNNKISCEICGKVFNNMTRLRDHQLRHSEVKNFECDLCKKRYYTLSSLKIHMKQHKGYKIVML